MTLRLRRHPPPPTTPEQREAETEAAITAALQQSSARAAIVVLIYDGKFTVHSMLEQCRCLNLVDETNLHATLRGLHEELHALVERHLGPNEEAK